MDAAAYRAALEAEAGLNGLSDDRRKAIAAELRSAKGDGPELETADAPAPPETADPPKARGRK